MEASHIMCELHQIPMFCGHRQYRYKFGTHVPQLQKKKKMTAREVVSKVCGLLGNVTADEVMSKSREYRIVVARQLVMWYIVKVLNLTLSEAGRMFGKSHATVSYAVRQVETILESNRNYDRRVCVAAKTLINEV